VGGCGAGVTTALQSERKRDAEPAAVLTSHWKSQPFPSSFLPLNIYSTQSQWSIWRSVTQRPEGY